MKHPFLFPMLSLMLVLPATAQEKAVKLSGSVQSDWLLPENDATIGANKDDYRGNVLGNSYVLLNIDSKWITAGARFETMENPLPGFENTFDTKPFHGTGLPNFWLTVSNHKYIEMTAGTFYEQFGSGFILRSYEERSLGIDNSLLGARLVVQPYKGIRLKMLGGFQRYHFSWNDDSPIYGGDLELNLDQWFKPLAEKGHYLTLGASGVVRYQADRTDTDILPSQILFPQVNYYDLKTPDNVGAMDFRLQWQYADWNLLAEYAIKGQDPYYNDIRLSNGQKADYIYHNGSAAMLSASYSHSGLSLLFQAKRSENMGFRSDRNAHPTVASLYVNHQPAFAFQHTYSLASLYPYATQMDGEWAFQGDISYRFKRKTLLGGKYGTLVRLNMSHIRGLQLDPVSQNAFGSYRGTDGYKTHFFDMTDEVYYQDINLTVEKKLSKDWKLTAMYMYQQYNQEIIEGHTNGNYNIVESHILVGDVHWQVNRNLNLRMEGQYLTTHQDKGDWAYLSLEASLFGDWMISLADQYNTSVHGGQDVHYYQGMVTYSKHSHQLQLGYGRTREGLNCNGGVCRKVPAQKGFTLSWTYNF